MKIFTWNALTRAFIVFTDKDSLKRESSPPSWQSSLSLVSCSRQQQLHSWAMSYWHSMSNSTQLYVRMCSKDLFNRRNWGVVMCVNALQWLTCLKSHQRMEMSNVWRHASLHWLPDILDADRNISIAQKLDGRFPNRNISGIMSGRKAIIVVRCWHHLYGSDIKKSFQHVLSLRWHF